MVLKLVCQNAVTVCQVMLSYGNRTKKPTLCRLFIFIKSKGLVEALCNVMLNKFVLVLGE